MNKNRTRRVLALRVFLNPFDADDNAFNIQERGLAFTLLSEMDWSTTYIAEDKRQDYGGRRFRVLSCIGRRSAAAVFTPRADKLHVISLRKANSREVKIYEKTLES